MPDPTLHLSSSKLALLARQLRPQRDLLLGEPIAVVGMGVKFPGGADSPDAYWRLLAEGRDTISPIPGDRWDAGTLQDYARDPGMHWGSFLPDVFDFDAEFFNITPREAIAMDPQQRLLLEVCWEALENAGISPAGVFGSQTGVFVGISYTDYGRLPGARPTPAAMDTYITTGTVLSVAAGRISYALGLRGPCMAVDTACSSSLVSVHLACNSLRSGECDAALAGGVNVLSPPGMIAFSKLKALAANGRCKAFDAAADGYVRGEGCGMIVLKRLSDALAAGDAIQALIRGSAVNQDGRSAGLTAPNGPAQEAVIRKALSGLDPSRVDYIETHGTGTPLGDPIEVGAIAAAMRGVREPGKPLAIGSVKTNLGHLESAAGIAGLIKVILALQHEMIPAHLNFRSLNPNINLEGIPAVIPAGPLPWKRNQVQRMAGTSSFGFSGTNAHVVVEEAPLFPDEPAATALEKQILALSTKTPSALRHLVSRYIGYLDANPRVNLADLCFTANIGRSHFSCRAVFTASTVGAMRDSLAAFPHVEIPTGSDNASLLAQAYMRGEDVRWGQIDSGHSRRKISLPTYPFERRRFNITDGARSAPSFWFHEFRWRKTGVSVLQPGLATPSAKKVLLLAHDSGSLAVAEAVKDTFEKQGVPCVISTAPQLTPDDLATARSIICLWSLDSRLPETPPDPGVLDRLLGLMQSLAPLERSGAPRIWLVTRGAQSPESASQPIAIAQAPFWGFGRVAAHEHAGLWGGLIDLDPVQTVHDAASLLDALTSGSSEGELAYRNGDRYVGRLAAAGQGLRGSSPAVVRESASYLITGGLGALGLVVADWLAERGAKRLALLGRSAPAGKQLASIRHLEQKGVQVLVLQADISNAGDAERIFRIIARELSPLHGIVHAAGVLDDGFIVNQSADRLRKTLDPKVQGAWHLHTMSADCPLDWFVLFSSASALLGPPGQAAYAAGNEFLNALACRRRQLGLPALSVNWGPWEKIGMMVKAEERISGGILGHEGIGSMSPDLAIDALDRLLGSDATTSLVMNADWPVVARLRPPDRGLGILSELIAQPTSAPVAKSLDLRNHPSNERLAILKTHLRALLGRILGVEGHTVDETRNLLDLGVDSLMAMEIVTDLQRDLALVLYPREFYEHPTLNGLAAYLNDELDRGTSREASSEAGTRATLIARAEDSPRPPARLSSEKNPPIVFLLSSPRSGSTLLRTMLAGHPRLFCPPELHLLGFEGMRDRANGLGPTHLSEGLEHAFVELSGCDAAHSRVWLDGLVERNAPVQEVYRILQDLAGDRLIVDKSPSYAGRVETLEFAEETFDRPRYIHLVRHPQAVIESFVRLRMHKLLGVNDADPYWVAEQVWMATNHNTRKFLSGIDTARWRLVVYEDLVRSPERIARELSSFLDIPFDPALLHPYEGERMTRAFRPQSSPIGDPNFLNHSSIQPGLADAWRHVGPPHSLSSETSVLARELGYDADFAGHPDATGHSAASRTDPRERVLNVRGLDFCLCTWGEPSQPTVVCVHGALDHGGSWDAIASRIAMSGYHVLAPDLRGHGKSGHSGPEGGYHVLDFLGDLDAIVRAESEGPIILAGHSMGALVAALFAAARPDRVSALILVEPVVPESSKGEVDAVKNYLEYLAKPLQHSVLPGLGAAAERLRKAAPSLTEERALASARRITRPAEDSEHPDGVRWTWDPRLLSRSAFAFGLEALNRLQWMNLIRQSGIPVLVVNGDSSPFPKLRESVAGDVQSTTISGSHNLLADSPDALADCILRFIGARGRAARTGSGQK